MKKFPAFEDEWLRGGPVRRWVPKAFADKPIYVFETGGTTGIPKSRIAIDDFRIDYELFSDTLPDKYFPKGANWLMLGPSGPRRLRLAVEHLAQHRGGICFCIDLDPRWVIKLIKKGWMEHLEAYKQHCIDQAHHDSRAPATTSSACSPRPSCSSRCALELEKQGSSILKTRHHGHLLRRHRVHAAVDALRHRGVLRRPAEQSGIYMTPTYGNTLMGLAASKPVTAADGYKISYYAPQPRAVVEVVEFDDYNQVVGYGETGRVKLTTLTKEFFMPGFLERDEGEREPPYEKYPWDGVSGVRPFHELAEATTVGVY